MLTHESLPAVAMISSTTRCAHRSKKNENTGNKPPEASQRKRQKGQRKRLHTLKHVNR
jgi:hypothetical protein